MTKNGTKTAGAIIFLVLGTLTLLFKANEYLTDTAASIILAILMIASVSSYFVVERAYKSKGAYNAPESP